MISPAQARKLGLAMAYQDTSLILAHRGQEQPLPRRACRPAASLLERKRWARRALREFDLDIASSRTPGGMLTLAEPSFRVAKALITDPTVLLLDEPTTALVPNEVEAPTARWRPSGPSVGIVYVSHRLPEVLRDRRPDHGAA